MEGFYKKSFQYSKMLREKNRQSTGSSRDSGNHSGSIIRSTANSNKFDSSENSLKGMKDFHITSHLRKKNKDIGGLNS